MILSSNLYGSFKGNPFIIGTTNRNEYYPVYAATHFIDRIYDNNNYYNGERLMENIVNEVSFYKKPTNGAERRYGSLSKYADLIEALTKSVNSDVFEFTISETSYYLTCNKGYIADIDDNILLILCTKSTTLFDDDGNIIPNNLRLYVSNNFVTNPIYKNVYKKIDSEYIHFCYENDIEVVFTTSEKIQKQVFKNDFEVTFDNLSQLQEHLTSGLGDNIFFNEEEYLIEHNAIEAPVKEQDADYEELPF